MSADDIIYEARKLRYINETEEAREKLIVAFELIDQLESPHKERSLSKALYEQAFCYGIMGNYADAIKYFRQSAEAADLAGSSILGLNSVLQYNLNLYYGLEKNVKVIYEEIRELATKALDIQPVDEFDGVALEQAQYNLTAHTMELAFDAGDDDWVKWATSMESSPFFSKYRRGEKPSFDAYRLRKEAREHFQNECFEESVMVFGCLVGFNTPYTSRYDDIADLTKIQQYIQHYADRPARDYRDFRRAVLKSSITGRVGIAQKIAEIATQLNPGRGNLVFQRDIEADAATSNS